MKRAKLKIEILTVIFCSLIFAFSEKNNSIYADEVLTDMELPTGRLLFEEETEEAVSYTHLDVYKRQGQNLMIRI